MRTLFKTAAFAPIAMAAALALSPAAHAAQTELRFADLDLSTPAGQAELATRVEKAAKEYCTPEAITGSRLRGQPDAACVADVRGRLNAQLASRVNRAKTAEFASRQP